MMKPTSQKEPRLFTKSGKPLPAEQVIANIDAWLRDVEDPDPTDLSYYRQVRQWAEKCLARGEEFVPVWPVPIVTRSFVDATTGICGTALIPAEEQIQNIDRWKDAYPEWAERRGQKYEKIRAAAVRAVAEGRKYASW